MFVQAPLAFISMQVADFAAFFNSVFHCEFYISRIRNSAPDGPFIMHAIVRAEQHMLGFYLKLTLFILCQREVV